MRRGRRVLAALLWGAVCAEAWAEPSSEWTKEGLLELAKEAVFKGAGATGGELLGVIDDVVIDSIVAGTTTPGLMSEKLSRAFEDGSVGALKVAWPAYGITYEAGKMVVGSAIYTVEQMYEAGRTQKLDAIIFGRSEGGLLGAVDNPLAQQDFMSSPAVHGAGITTDNFGEKITSEEQLKTLWFTQYRNTLTRDLPFSPETVDPALNEAWPRLLDFWQKKRGAYMFGRFKDSVAEQIRLLAQKEKEPEPEYKASDPQESMKPAGTRVDCWVICMDFCHSTDKTHCSNCTPCTDDCRPLKGMTTIQKADHPLQRCWHKQKYPDGYVAQEDNQ